MSSANPTFRNNFTSCTVENKPHLRQSQNTARVLELRFGGHPNPGSLDAESRQLTIAESCRRAGSVASLSPAVSRRPRLMVDLPDPETLSCKLDRAGGHSRSRRGGRPGRAPAWRAALAEPVPGRDR